MVKIINLKTFSDERGDLTVLENSLPFDIKRVYYIYNAKGIRGGHRHKKTSQAIICIKGSFDLFVNNGNKESNFHLDSPEKCILLDPKDWHEMKNFSKDIVILVLASENYNKNDYVFEAYN